MKDLLPEILDIGHLNKLAEKGKALFFNYLGNLNKFSKTPEEVFLKILNGEGHILVNSHLYTKYGNFDYKLQIENWIETKEAEKYAPLLWKIFYKKNSPRFISNHMN